MASKRNVIELHDGIIFYTQAGDQSGEAVTHSVNAIRLLADGMPEVKILVDYTHSGKLSKEALQAGFYALKDINFDKVAIFGASPYMRKLVNTMASAAGKGHIIHFAKTRKEAQEWLNK